MRTQIITTLCCSSAKVVICNRYWTLKESLTRMRYKYFSDRSCKQLPVYMLILLFTGISSRRTWCWKSFKTSIASSWLTLTLQSIPMNFPALLHASVLPSIKIRWFRVLTHPMMDMRLICGLQAFLCTSCWQKWRGLSGATILQTSIIVIKFTTQMKWVL